MREDIEIEIFETPVRASVDITSSKSITNRALILSALRGGNVLLKNPLYSRDTEIMIDCLQRFGFEIEASKESIEIKNFDLRNGKKRANFFVGNAGTVARFFTAFVCGIEGGEYIFDSDEAMYNRPMSGLIKALSNARSDFEFGGKEFCFPFKVKTFGFGGSRIRLDASKSSQMLSALLMSSVMSKNDTIIELVGDTVSRPFISMTIEMMRSFGFDVIQNGNEYKVLKSISEKEERLEYLIEPDATAASYFIALPSVVGGAVLIKNFPKSTLQGDRKFVDLMEEAGLIEKSFVGDNLLIKRSSMNIFPQRMTFDFNDISDTFLTLGAISPLLPYELEICGIGHTRSQETDRILALSNELKKFPCEVYESSDKIVIKPKGLDEMIKSSKLVKEIETYHDHRISMSFAILGCADLSGGRWVKVLNAGCCAKTWREFYDVLESVRVESGHFKIVAIDGGAAVGKSSVSKECSRILDYMHVDTGSHYRTLCYILLSKGTDCESEIEILDNLNGIELGTEIIGNSARMTVSGRLIEDSLIRTDEINRNVAKIAAVAGVRKFLKDYQRSMANIAKERGFGGLVMEGRDIGSIIFPDANVRIFLDADEETREKRRASEGISDAITQRDRLDSTRKTAPLICVSGAERIDTSNMSKQEVIDKTISLIL